MTHRSSIVLLLCAALCVSCKPAFAQAGQFPDLGHIGPSKGEIAGILVGAGVVIGVVVYLVIPKHKTINGCVVSSDGGLRLTSDEDKQTYALTTNSENGQFNRSLQPGRRVLLKGKRGKTKSGTRDFHVTELIRDEGTCSAGLSTPGS
jgi:hypothetical protein